MPSRSCPAVGSSNARWPGSPRTGAAPATTSVCPVPRSRRVPDQAREQFTERHLAPGGQPVRQPALRHASSRGGGGGLRGRGQTARPNGRLVQYGGRILRPYDGKATAEVHDYHDELTGVLASSLTKRAPGYTSLGFPDPRKLPYPPVPTWRPRPDRVARQHPPTLDYRICYSQRAWKNGTSTRPMRSPLGYGNSRTAIRRPPTWSMTPSIQLSGSGPALGRPLVDTITNSKARLPRTQRGPHPVRLRPVALRDRVRRWR
jgi:hypothetical protein